MNEMVKSKGGRKRIQFSLTLALIGFTLVCVMMAWFNWTQRFARATRAMKELHVTVSYDEASNLREKPQPHKLPKWKGRIFGEDFCFRMNRLDIFSSSVESSPEFWKTLAKHRSAMSEVEVVLLSRVEVDGRALKTLEQLPLTEIYFIRCRFKDVDLDRLAGFAKLRTVLFSEIDQDVDYRRLSECEQLVQIGLEGCAIDLETADYLRANLPEAYVFAF